MFVGHFALGLIGKRADPKLSLGTLIMAVMLADLLWCILTLAGLEYVRFGEGRGAGAYLLEMHAPWSHSLLMGIVWGGVLAAAYFSRWKYPRGAWILFAAVVSHWVLDVISHRPDMPLAPGVTRYFGLGLWTSIPATLIVEGGLWAVALVLYTRATRPRRRTGFYAFWIGVAVLTAMWRNNIAGSPPPAHIAPIGSLVTFSLAVAWAYWIDRARIHN